MQTAPLCTSCNHHHEQGVRCTVCGHVGKSQIFMKMRMKSEERRALRIEVISSSMCQSLPPIHDLLASMLPTQYPQLQSEVAYMMLYKGDSAIGAASFTLYHTQSAAPSPMTMSMTPITTPPPQHALHILYIYIHPEYRGHKFAYYLIHSVLQYCHSVTCNNNTSSRDPLSLLLMGWNLLSTSLHGCSSLGDKLRQEGFVQSSGGIHIHIPIHIHGGVEALLSQLRSRFEKAV